MIDVFLVTADHYERLFITLPKLADSVDDFLKQELIDCSDLCSL